MALASWLTMFWAPQKADVAVVVNDPTAVVVRRRKTDRSKKVYIDVWASAGVTVNGEQVNA